MKTPRDYNIYYKSELPREGDWSHLHKWDVFISAFNSSDRVRIVFDKINASEKVWIIHNEYTYDLKEHPIGTCFTSPADDEAKFVMDLIAFVEKRLGKPINDISLCVDITGFMRPHLLFLALFLSIRRVPKYHVIYTEPQRYAKKEKTTFSGDDIVGVRQVSGFEGANNPNDNADLLIIGSGYDHKLISAVAGNKGRADKVQIFGLPSLRADMYQENVLNAYKAADAIGKNKILNVSSYFAPANDPFVTATVLSEIVWKREKTIPITNLYLSPLATKSQALGFALFYIGECSQRDASIIFPVARTYARETSTGLSRVWLYTVEHPL